VGRHVADLVAASEARLDGRCWRRSDCARRRSGCARRSRRQRKEEERLRKEEKRLREEEELELRKVAWEKARLRQEEDEERRRIAVTEALEVRKSELERELQENDLNRQQQAELKQLKVTLGELAAASRPENRWTKCGAEALVASCSREASKTMGGDEGSEEADRILLLALLVRAPAF
jgi:hypothetical protein